MTSVSQAAIRVQGKLMSCAIDRAEFAQPSTLVNADDHCRVQR